MPAEAMPDLLHENELDEVSLRALALIDTADYAVARNSPLARAALRKRHPEGMIVTLDIGPAETLRRPARWLLASPVLARPAK